VEIQKESEDYDMRRSMITSIDTVTQVSIKFGEKKKAHKNVGISRGNNKTQTIHMKMAINVNEYGTGGRRVYMFRHTYAGIRIINIQIEKEDRHMGRVIQRTRAPCQSYA